MIASNVEVLVPKVVKVVNGKKFYAEPLTPGEVAKHQSDCKGAPSVYVGTYGKYAGGDLYGMWVDISTFDDKEDFLEFCRRLHADEYDPECMYQDFECFPKDFYSESSLPIDTIIEWSKLGDYNKEIVQEYFDEVSSWKNSGEPDDFSDIIDSCVYHGDNKNDYYDQLAYDMYPDFFKDGVPGEYYFNFEKWERDCRLDYTETENCIFDQR